MELSYRNVISALCFLTVPRPEPIWTRCSWRKKKKKRREEEIIEQDIGRDQPVAREETARRSAKQILCRVRAGNRRSRAWQVKTTWRATGLQRDSSFLAQIPRQTSFPPLSRVAPSTGRIIVEYNAAGDLQRYRKYLGYILSCDKMRAYRAEIALRRACVFKLLCARALGSIFTSAISAPQSDGQ